MKASLLTMIAAAAVAAALPAHAADLGVPVPGVPMEAPTLAAPASTTEHVAPRASGPIDWSGAYVGFQVGGTFDGRLDVGSDPVSRSLLRNGRGYSGFIGGGHVGFDYQVGSIVVGGIGSINYVNLGGKSAGPFSYAGADGGINNYFASGSAGLDVEGTVRARLGFAGLDLPVLPYVTGGLAVAQGSANFRLTGATTDDAGVTTTSNFNLKDTRSNLGYAVGGGFDYAFTDNIRGRVEYLYHDLSQTRYFKGIQGGVDVGGSYSTVTGGVSYRW